MRRFFRNEKTKPFDEQINKVLKEMSDVGVNSEEYQKMLTLIERLNDIKTKQRRDPVSSDTIAVVTGNLMGILLIIAYEQKHVITSKGFSQIIRPKTP